MTTHGKTKFQLHVYLPEETDKLIRQLAAKENRSLSRQFTTLIEEALAARAAGWWSMPDGRAAKAKSKAGKA